MPHHQGLFKGDRLFDRIARTVCLAGTLPRKELYEAWETARRVRRRFRGGRVLDMACGHGLLAHIMMILDDTSPEAVAVDQQIPDNANVLSKKLIKEWPRLSGRVHYIETDIQEVSAAKGDILVSVHACGRLTDQVLDKAVNASARVAVLPCCHDAKQCDTVSLEGWMDKSLAIDAGRVFHLKANGYHVITQTIPDDITPKNRLLMAEPEKNKKAEKTA